MRVPRWRLELFQMSRCPVPEAQMRFTDAQMRHQIPDVQRPQRAPSRCPGGRKLACARQSAPRGGHAGARNAPRGGRQRKRVDCPPLPQLFASTPSVARHDGRHCARLAHSESSPSQPVMTLFRLAQIPTHTHPRCTKKVPPKKVSALYYMCC